MGPISIPIKLGLNKGPRRGMMRRWKFEQIKWSRYAVLPLAGEDRRHLHTVLRLNSMQTEWRVCLSVLSLTAAVCHRRNHNHL